MEIKPIRNEADYDAALQEIEALFDAAPDTPEVDRLDVLVALVEAYEARHHAIPAPDPIEAIEHEMERQGMTPRDLDPYLGSRSRVWEVLYRRRPLTLKMIRVLSKGLSLPAGVLVQDYETEPPASRDVAYRPAAGNAGLVLRERPDKMNSAGSMSQTASSSGTE
jgi:HTH-type transcriptional regulator / antitoxin HigA